MSNSLDPGHTLHLVGADRDQTVCKGYQQKKTGRQGVNKIPSYFTYKSTPTFLRNRKNIS